MDNNELRKLSVRYAIHLDKIELYYNLSQELDIHIYDVVTLMKMYHIPQEVRKYAHKYKFEQKFLDWYDGKRVIADGQSFRPAARYFEEHGVYTTAIPNKHPQSEFMKFWTEERRRCIYGYHTGTDWISGYNYFYLNYSPIQVVKEITGGSGKKKRAERTESFPFLWDGDYYYFHYLEEAERRGEHAVVLKARGRGYSFKGGSMLNRNFALIPHSRSMVFVEDKQYLVEDGILTKAWEIMSFIDEHTAWAKRRTKKSTDFHRRASMEVTVDGIKREDGFMSEIIGVSLGDNIHKARGKRAKLILYEEAGSFNNLLQAWIVNEASVQQGDFTYGLRVAFGTGGEEGSGFDGLKDLFFKSKTNSVYSIPDVWNVNTRNNTVGYFVPEYINLEGYYDKHGNSDIQGAKKKLLDDRIAMIENNTSPVTMARKKAEQPMTPHEAVLRADGSPFPIIDLRDRLIELQTKPELKGISSIGSLVVTSSGGVKWVTDVDGKLTPINTLDVTEDNRRGCIQIFRHPERDGNGEITNGLYIIGTDPIDFDRDEVSNKYSLGSTFVMNALTEQIVAEYTGRPDTATEYYETVRRLCLYYNAEVMYENNIKGMGVYFINNNSEHLLANRPKVLEDALDYKSKANRRKGYTATSRVNAYGRNAISEWLSSPWGEEGEAKKTHSILSEGLLEELINWNRDGNFDRVSALVALMIHLKDIDKIKQGIREKIDKPKETFWTKAIRRR